MGLPKTEAGLGQLRLVSAPAMVLAPIDRYSVLWEGQEHGGKSLC